MLNRRQFLVTIAMAPAAAAIASPAPPMPTIPIQSRGQHAFPRCASTFPTTAAQRRQAAFDPESAFYECGYSPDACNPMTGLYAPKVFTSCDYTEKDCRERGMYHRFAGIASFNSAMVISRARFRDEESHKAFERHLDAAESALFKPSNRAAARG